MLASRRRIDFNFKNFGLGISTKNFNFCMVIFFSLKQTLNILLVVESKVHANDHPFSVNMRSNSLN
jgi:hypothetical protein